MIEMHYSARNNLQPKSLHDIGHFASPISSETTSPLDSNCKKEGSSLSIEHFSMLEATRHSPHSTSTSTLSSSHHAAGSVNQFMAEMQPFAAGMDLSAEKFNIGMNEWENLLSETGGNDQTLFRWIAGGVEDTSFGLKQNGFEANVGFEEIHQSSGTQVIPTYFSSPCENNNNVNNNMLASLNSSLSISPPESTLNCDNGKFCESTVLGVQVQQQMQPQFENLEQESRDCNNNLMVNQLPYVQCALSVNFLNPLLRGSHPDQPPTKRHNPGILNPCFGSQMEKVPLVDPHHERLLRKPKELPPLQQSLFGLGQHLNSLPAWHLPENGFMVPKKEMPSVGRNPESSVQQQDQQQQILYGQLYKAMEFILTRNFTQAQGILARLNHQLSPSIKPFQRSSLYFKEALEHAILMPNAATSLPLKIPNPFDGMLKMSAYKAFSEASPLIQFMNFTSNQALLEAVDDADCIHIIDFDIGFGAQWSSFIQELPRRKRGPPSSLKLTSFSSPSTHHTIEISLMHGSLTQFANDVGINFELEVLNFDSFDPKFYPICSLRSSDNEAIAVNLPIWSIESHLPLLPSLLCFIKQLSPKIVVSMERGCERFELPLPYHLLDALQYFEVLIDSLDAANMDPDSGNKIERFLFHPTIENIVLGRLQSLDIMPSWRKLFASACFSPVGFSNFAEAQAECVTKRTHIRGFNVEKRQASLVLCWHHHELLTVSAWRC